MIHPILWAFITFNSFFHLSIHPFIHENLSHCNIVVIFGGGGGGGGGGGVCEREREIEKLLHLKYVLSFPLSFGL